MRGTVTGSGRPRASTPAIRASGTAPRSAWIRRGSSRLVTTVTRRGSGMTRRTNIPTTGNGYANALIGVFKTYTELTNRVDRDRRHWQTEGYLQDSWRVNPRLTLDYGVRLTHSGGYYDTRKSTAGFLEFRWNASLAPRLYRPVCTTPVPGNQTCPGNSQRAYDPANPSVLLSSALVGNLVPGTGSQTNSMVADGYPGMRPGEYFKFTPLVAAPRVGFAWNISGDGKQALRASSGIFYRIPDRGAWEGFVGDPPASFSRVVQFATFDDISNFANANLEFVETPISVEVAGGETRSLEKSYNVNVAYQRDIGFSTTAEIAYVGAFTYSGGRTEDINRPVNNLYLLSDPSRMFNGNGLATNFLRTNYPGMGVINQWMDQKDGATVNNKTLQYNSMQVSVQRSLNRGLQAGMAYTLAKGRGWTGYSPDVLEADPTGELNRLRFWGPTGDDRTHKPDDQLQLPDSEPPARHAGGQVDPGRLAGVGCHEVSERHGDAAELHHQQPRHRQHQPDADAGCDVRVHAHRRADLRGGARSESARRGPAARQSTGLHDAAAAQPHGRQLRQRAARHPAKPRMVEP